MCHPFIDDNSTLIDVQKMIGGNNFLQDEAIDQDIEFPFDAVIILSEFLWKDSTSIQERFYAKLFSRKASVFYVQKYTPEKDNWFEKDEEHDGITILNPIKGYSMNSLFNVIQQVRKISQAKKILFWLYTGRYSDYLKSTTFPTTIVFHALHVSLEKLDFFKKAFNNASFIVSPKELSLVINMDDKVSTKAYELTDATEDMIYSEALCNPHLVELTNLLANYKLYNNDHLRDQKKKVLLLYSVASCRVNTIREHVNAFGLFSRHEITYYDATNDNLINQSFLDSFDAIVLHFSVRISVKGHLSEDIYKKLKNYSGAKLLFIQDEYDNLAMTYVYMHEIGFDSVFTCVPDQYVDYVYPSSKFKGVKFINNFTGYIPYVLLNYNFPKIADRQTHVFYRGRSLPYFYGTLGKEKYEIGIKFQEVLLKTGIELSVDIEAAENKRIYGEAWYYTLSRSKATLATESGSNVFDFDGNLEQLIEADVKQGKDYEFIYEKYIKEREERIQMNQISPKIFEAICLGTVLVLYEGSYSGVLTPWVHYIPLKKDFSNFTKIVSILKDDIALQKIADKAYQDIIQNSKYTYQSFIRDSFDNEIDNQVVVLRDRINRSSKTSNLRNRLINYFYARPELSKILVSSASPAITSQTYESFYLEPVNTWFWRLKDVFYQFLYFFPLFLRHIVKTIERYTILISRSFAARIQRLKNNIKKINNNKTDKP